MPLQPALTAVFQFRGLVPLHFGAAIRPVRRLMRVIHGPLAAPACTSTLMLMFTYASVHLQGLGPHPQCMCRVGSHLVSEQDALIVPDPSMCRGLPLAVHLLPASAGAKVSYSLLG